MKRTVLLRALGGATLCVLVLAVAAMAQPGSGGPTPTTVPIDGGASLLLASGVALTLKKLRDRKKRRERSRL